MSPRWLYSLSQSTVLFFCRSVRLQVDQFPWWSLQGVEVRHWQYTEHNTGQQWAESLNQQIFLHICPIKRCVIDSVIQEFQKLVIFFCHTFFRCLCNTSKIYFVLWTNVLLIALPFILFHLSIHFLWSNTLTIKAIKCHTYLLSIWLKLPHRVGPARQQAFQITRRCRWDEAFDQHQLVPEQAQEFSR